MTDRAYMLRALRLAARARGRTSPNPMVGCVLVKGGRIVGAGYHHRAGLPHAEAEALAAAGRKARGATAYVTLEPCNHIGRTGPCSEALIAAGVARVVVAMADPNPKVAGGGAARLRAAGIPVEIGLCEAEARELVGGFVSWVVTGRPRVTLKAAITLDGRIATRSGDSRWVTGEAARAEVHRMRDACDAILVGVGTVTADDPALTTRLTARRAGGGGRRGRDPLRVILDGMLQIDEEARVIGPGALVVCTRRASRVKEQALRARGADVARLEGSRGLVETSAVLDELGRRGVLELLVEGGAEVHGGFLRARLADRVVAFIAPKIAGSDGVPFAQLPSPARMADALRLTDVRVRRFGEDLCVTGRLR